MKKVLFGLVALVALSSSVSSCKKCVVCTYSQSGTASTEYCESGAARTAFENACKAGGGTVSTK